ncbi:MAPEG family protein [Neisseria wadsworthii]|uniref:MAPEG family protein n=1 Tax=Neisseria wadsworthii 9715 TaxID=1030841 RepID=G4CNI1_9NEIS|nr:MAPEG family protein [Neisseria wadsworthii]EGZ49995.1 MAPEG family protein [Neisseria wadsworthii 9715]QMT36605.1 MAPEG family protein [Neisseria wadsworthii]
MNFIHIVTILALIQYFFFGFMVGRARSKYGIHAPAVSGNEHFERALRIQQNTLEQLVVFLPALFIAAVYWSEGIIALIGVVYLVGRFIYWRAYTADPQTRAIGFLLTMIPSFVLMIAGLIGAMFKA